MTDSEREVLFSITPEVINRLIEDLEQVRAEYQSLCVDFDVLSRKLDGAKELFVEARALLSWNDFYDDDPRNEWFRRAQALLPKVVAIVGPEPEESKV